MAIERIAVEMSMIRDSESVSAELNQIHPIVAGESQTKATGSRRAGSCSDNLAKLHSEVGIGSNDPDTAMPWPASLFRSVDVTNCHNRMVSRVNAYLTA